eukprot:Lithocolla_globosa_v1_NODE_2482_length_1985_cov_17.467876.p1 type:complete len:317 gc:universal NODE_2482_length_1985_cov_17.467876:743-1693(+)
MRPILDAMIGGTTVMKVREKKVYERTFFLSPDLTTISWKPSKMNERLPVAGVKEVLSGQKTMGFERTQVEGVSEHADRSFSLLSYKDLLDMDVKGKAENANDLYGETKESSDVWVKGLTWLTTVFRLELRRLRAHLRRHIEISLTLRVIEAATTKHQRPMDSFAIVKVDGKTVRLTKSIFSTKEPYFDEEIEDIKLTHQFQDISVTLVESKKLLGSEPLGETSIKAEEVKQNKEKWFSLHEPTPLKDSNISLDRILHFHVTLSTTQAMIKLQTCSGLPSVDVVAAVQILPDTEGMSVTLAEVGFLLYFFSPFLGNV